MITRTVPADLHAKFLGKVGKISANAVLSGTVSELGGGKFANGAITGAFSVMFNDLMSHPILSKEEIMILYEKYKSLSDKTVSEVYQIIGGPLGEWAQIEGFGNACAARMSYALNYGGFEIPQGTKGAYLGGDKKYYIINAKVMKNYLIKLWGKPQNIGNRINKVVNAVFFQFGPDFSPKVSGHVDVIFNGKAAHHKYEYNKRNTNLIWY